MKLELKGNPYPKQIEFFQSRARYTAYGGARGGGKSWAARRKALLLCLRYEGMQILFLRRKFTDLKENHLLPMQSEVKSTARFDSQSKAFIFPNDSRLKFGYCDNEGDVLQYQGQAYDVIFMEEATQFTEFMYQTLTECNRSSGMMKEKFSPRMYFTCNPGGVGHAWVKRLFIEKNYRNKEKRDNYKFIRSTVYENDFLMENNPEYVEALENLPEQRRKAMLDGDWDIFEGQFFTEWRDDIDHYDDRCFTHVIPPFVIPEHWPRYRGFDFGYAKPFSCSWYAIDPDGVMYKYRELYGCTGEPDTGVRWEPERIAKEIRDIENKFEKGRYIRGIADPAIWNKEMGESVADIMTRYRIYFERGDNDRLNGWMQIHNRLAFDEIGKSMFYVFTTCVNHIRTIPTLIHDNVKVEDIESSGEDHIADEWRYVCMSRPIKARPLVKHRQLAYDPLSDTNENNWQPYIGMTRL